MSRTWEDNAREFGALTKQGIDVRLALLVACSVEKGKGNGRPPQAGETAADAAVSKTSARGFARKAGTDEHRISRHLDAWNKMAETGACKPSSALTPTDADDPRIKVPDETAFLKAYPTLNDEGKRKAGGSPRATIKEIVDRVEKDPVYAAELSKAVTEAAPEAVADRIVKTPKGRKALQKAEEEHSEKVAKYKKASQDAKKEDKKKTPFSFAIVDGALTQAKRSLTEALRDAEGVQFDAEEQDLLSHDLDQITALLNLIRLRIAGNVEVDWDAELTKLTEA